MEFSIHWQNDGHEIHLPQRGEVDACERSENASGGGRTAMNIPPPEMPTLRFGISTSPRWGR